MRKNSKEYPSSLPSEELQKRREAVDSAINTNEIEGIILHKETLKILEEYANGYSSLEEFNMAMDKATLGHGRTPKKLRIKKAPLKELFSPSTPNPYHYTYPFSHLLKNRYGLTDDGLLGQQSAHDSAKAIINLQKEAPPDRFDLDYLKYIHKQLFQNVFEWAGHTRDVPFQFSDGTVAIMLGMKKATAEGGGFAYGDEIQKELKEFESVLAEKNNLRGLSREEFADAAASLFASLNHVHPFRDGNGRVQRVFFEKLAEAAGHKLDFSLVTGARMITACIVAEEKKNLSQIKHMFEDISNSEKRFFLKECISHIKQLGYDPHSYLIDVAEEGKTYRGFYQDMNSESFMISALEGRRYVVCQKSYLSLEQSKTLQPGDRFVFTVPNVLIPRGALLSLTQERMSQMIQEDSCVRTSREQLQHLSKVVYGRSGTLDKEMEQIIADPKLGENLAEQIAKNPRSIAKLSGFKMLGMKSHARAYAEESVPKLSETIEHYAKYVQACRKTFIQEHKDEQRRCIEVIAPSAALQKVLSMPEKERTGALVAHPELQTELESFLSKIKARFSPSEHEAVRNNNYEKLAKSLSISIDKAHKAIDLVQQSKEAHQKLRMLTVNHSQTISMMS